MPDTPAPDGVLAAAPQSEEWPAPASDNPELGGARPEGATAQTALANAATTAAGRSTPSWKKSAGRPKPGGRMTALRYVFVVSAARSGSTLLRYLLDSHPEITNPPELNLSSYLVHTVSMWSRVEETEGATPLRTAADDGDGAADGGGGGQEPSAEACRRGRTALDELCAAMVPDDAVKVFSDKSLTSVDHLDLLQRTFPDALFVFLYRYPLDMIASGIEASRWGFNAYGFSPFLGSAPGNFVGGLGNYWIDRASKMADFEKRCTVAHARIYYELLCGDPIETMKGLFEFLDVRHDVRTVKSVIRKALAAEHGQGPGDYKIDFTSTISRDSVGRGAMLPRMLGPQQIERIDQLLAELDYPSLDAAWQGDLGKLIGLKAPAGDGATSGVENVIAALERGRVAARAKGKRSVDLSWLPLELVVVEESGSQHLLSVDRRGVRYEGSPDGKDRVTAIRLRCTVAAISDAVSGRANLAQLLQDGRIRGDTGSAETRESRVATRTALKGLSELLAAGAVVDAGQRA